LKRATVKPTDQSTISKKLDTKQFKRSRRNYGQLKNVKMMSSCKIFSRIIKDRIGKQKTKGIQEEKEAIVMIRRLLDKFSV
jgi:hypothetical protein